jgi:hypothetical protein
MSVIKLSSGATFDFAEAILERVVREAWREWGFCSGQVTAETPDDPDLDAGLVEQGFQVARPPRRSRLGVTISRGDLVVTARFRDVDDCAEKVKALFDLNVPDGPARIRLEGRDIGEGSMEITTEIPFDRFVVKASSRAIEASSFTPSQKQRGSKAQ